MLTPKSLIDEYRIKTIDILQIDAEGMDLSLLNAFIASDIVPAVVNIETNHFSRAQRSELRSLFQEYQYDYIDAGLDTTAYRRSAFGLS